MSVNDLQYKSSCYIIEFSFWRQKHVSNQNFNLSHIYQWQN
jgi:hypothetical protein